MIEHERGKDIKSKNLKIMNFSLKKNHQSIKNRKYRGCKLRKDKYYVRNHERICHHLRKYDDEKMLKKLRVQIIYT